MHTGAYRETLKGGARLREEANIDKNEVFLWNPSQNVQKGGAKDRHPHPALYAYECI